MERSSMLKSRRVDTQDQPLYCDASLRSCVNSVTQQPVQHLSPMRPLARRSSITLNFLYHRNTYAAWLPHAHLGCMSASLKSWTRSNAGRSNTCVRDTVIWIPPTNSVKPLS